MSQGTNVAWAADEASRHGAKVLVANLRRHVAEIAHVQVAESPGRGEHRNRRDSLSVRVPAA